MSNVVHAIDIKNVVSNSVCGFILGLALAIVPLSTLMEVVIILIAFILMITNGIRVYSKMYHDKDTASNQLLLDLLGVMMGFVLLVYSNIVVTIVVSIYLIVEPIVELALVKFNKQLFMIELPKISLGAILLVSGFSVFDSIFKIIGGILLLASSFYFGFNYYLYKKSGVKIVK